MKSIKLTTSSIVRKINDRIRIAPSQAFRATDCLWLIVRDGHLLCPELGRRVPLELSAAEVRDDEDIARLADAAKALCGSDDRPKALLLPLPRFLYSHYAIQLGDDYLADRDMVHSAIGLQKDLLLPAFEEDFALAAAVGRAEGVAFWLSASLLDRLDSGFGAAGLELVAVMPRALAAEPAQESTSDYVVLDRDSASCSLIKLEAGVATQVLSAYSEEFENADIKAAWEEQSAQLLSDSPVKMTSADDWLGLQSVERGTANYLFFTKRFLGQVAGKNRQRRVSAAAAAAAAAVLFLSIPFFYQWADAIRLERAVDAYRAEARVAAEYEDEILDMEYEWGVVYEYPEADVAGILTGLNSVIRNSLTSFRLDDSTVEIQGFTEDPEQLTRLLVGQTRFETIEQSRSISDSNTGRGDRFGLRMTLADYDYEEYLRKYDFR